MTRFKTVFAALAFSVAGVAGIATVAQAATGWDQLVAEAAAKGISNVTPASGTPAEGVTLNFHGTDANGNPVYGWVTSTGNLIVSKVITHDQDDADDAESNPA